MVEEQALSITRSCAVAKLSRAAYYRSQADSAQRDGAVITALNEVVAKHQRWGFWKCFDRLRLLGHGWNHKRVYRVYCGMKLNLPRRTKQRVPQRERRSLVVPALPNAVWAVDFMSDTLYDGRRFRTLNVLDEGVREGLAIEVDTSLPAKRVVRVLTQLKEWRGLPQAIRLDNGPEFIAGELALWCDLRVAARNATFGVYCRRFGVPLCDGGTIRLPRLIGMSRAMDMILTGRGVSGEEAFTIGLANRVVEPGETLDAAKDLAEQIASFPQRCVRSDRMSAYECWTLPLDDALANEYRHGIATINSGETRAGAARFASGIGRHGKF